MIRPLLLIVCSLTLIVNKASAAEAPSRQQALAAMKQAATFFHEQVSIEGGYVWKYSADLTLHQGEAVTDDSRVWVQPPGTPAIGAAMLAAYRATDDQYYLDAARTTATCLIRGQMQSGGWDYYIELDDEKRKAFAYRHSQVGKKARNYSTLDDNVSQAATRFLVELDGQLKQADPAIHEAAEYALRAMLAAQYPNGGWYVWWKEYPKQPTAEQFPVKPASFPDEWQRTWKARYTGIYVTNDNLMPDMIDLLLTAHEVYGGEKYMDAARRAGDFLLLAQMPEPQPAWAQQYDVDMHPVWGRKFEPPAVSGEESQQIIGSLMQLYRATGERKYLQPIPSALAWLRRSQIEEGKVARFYELKTNRPLYFERRGDLYTLTYELGPRLPDHYGFVRQLRADRLEAEYRQCLAGRDSNEADRSSGGVSQAFAKRVGKIIDQMDSRGAWTEEGWVRNAEAKKVVPDDGIIESATFLKNFGQLTEYVRRVEP